MNKQAVLEGLLFVSGDEGLTKEQLMELLEIDENNLNEIIDNLKDKYIKDDSGITLKMLGNHYKLTTKEEHKEYYEKLVEIEEGNLSEASLETLAIIAYNQPVTRLTVDEIRGINSSYVVRKLVARELIEEKGRSDSPGRPILYGVTDKFLDYFGLSSIEDLPEIKETETKDEDVDLFESKYKES